MTRIIIDPLRKGDIVSIKRIKSKELATVLPCPNCNKGRLNAFKQVLRYKYRGTIKDIEEDTLLCGDCGEVLLNRCEDYWTKETPQGLEIKEQQ